jgi:hypothetical protein
MDIILSFPMKERHGGVVKTNIVNVLSGGNTCKE